MRTDFTSSSLVRLLGPWAGVPADGAGPGVGERLGALVNAFDAIGLQSAHATIRTLPPPPVRCRAPAGTADLADDVQRLRSTLARAIGQPVVPGDGYARYQQRHAELQRTMEQLVRPLRDHVRQRVAPASHALRQLAALDAVVEPLLSAREQALLPQVAAVLGRRFAQLQASADAHPGWLDDFERDWRQALLAEVELRLEPVQGLVDALTQELNTQA